MATATMFGCGWIPRNGRAPADLLELDLPGQSGRTLVPLTQVASVDTGSAPSNIRRLDLMREVRISANTQGRSLGEVVNEIKQQVPALEPAPGLHRFVHGRGRGHGRELRIHGRSR